MAQDHHITTDGDAKRAEERPAPAYPLSASKTSAARRRDLTAAIIRARAA